MRISFVFVLVVLVGLASAGRSLAESDREGARPAGAARPEANAGDDSAASGGFDPIRGVVLDRALRRPFSVTRAASELRPLLTRVSQATSATIWIDPRIDPRSQVQPQAERDDPSLRGFLVEMARQASGRLSRWGDTLVIVPDDRIRSLALLRDHERSDTKRSDTKRGVVTENGAESEFAAAIAGSGDVDFSDRPVVVVQELFDHVCETGAIDVDGDASLWHDVWVGPHWIDVADTLAIAAVLVPMDYGFEWIGDGRIRLTPLANEYPYPVRYRLRAVVDNLFPGRRQGLIFTGTAFEHDAIAAAIAARKPHRSSRATGAANEFTLTLRSTRVGSVLKMIDENKLPIVFTAASIAEVDLQTRIDLTVEKVTAAELADAIAEASGLVVQASDPTTTEPETATPTDAADPSDPVNETGG